MLPIRRCAVAPAVVALLSAFLLCPRDTVPGVRAADGDDPKPGDKEPEERIRPYSDAKSAARLATAAEAVKAEDWVHAVRPLQHLLDLDEDRTAQGGKEPARPVGVRAEALRRLAALPVAGREAYQAEFGPDAGRLLKQALKDKDEQRFAEVVRRFLYTDAGPEALEALAALHYDAGHYRLAALYYSHLLSHKGIARWTPEALYQAATAFHMTGDAARADLVGKQLLPRIGPEGLRVAAKTLSWEDVQKDLAKPVEASGEWPMYGGDPARSGQGVGGPAFLVKNWILPTLGSSASDVNQATANAMKMEGLYAAAATQLTQVNQAVLPSYYPVEAVVTMRNGKKTPLVVYRTTSGIVTADLKAGVRKGISPMKGTFDWMMQDAGRHVALDQWMQAYLPPQNQRPGILFENTSTGTLSTDGLNAYAVEDLVVPPPPSFRVNIGFPDKPNPFGWPADVIEAVNRNKLAAYDLAGGCKLAWEVGGGKNGELSDSLFIGPPLPLDGRLYVLNEKEGELRLVCVDAAKGKLLSVQTLAVVRDLLSKDSIRRTHAAHLAYADGVLICPTNAGAVVGVDLATGNIAWMYRYEEALPAAVPPRPFPRPMPAGRAAEGWRTTAPIIHDGKVVFTTPDGSDLTCLDLHDGSVLWTWRRASDDLYLAGVFGDRVLVVGRKSCRAFGLADREPLWTLETGLPSGQGAASGDVYYLPVKESIATKEPEICAIDVRKGQIVGHARSRQKDVPGNLVFADDCLLSQTATEIVAYPLLKAKLARMNEALAKNSNDPEGLTDRGELRLEEGDLEGAVADLHKALKNDPPKDVLAVARAKLYEALTEYLQRDFKASEKYLKDYEELCKTGTGSEAEDRRRLAGYFRLTGLGYEGEGRLLDAFQAYRELAALPDDVLLPAAGDPTLTMRPAVWVQSRMAELLKKASPEQRKRLEEEIAKLHKAMTDRADPDERRRFVALFGGVSADGREARFDLAARLFDQGKYREAEVHLEALRRQKDDPVLAGRAVEDLALVAIREGQLEDAAYYYKVLDRDYGAVVVRAGKTGADLLKDAATDKRLIPFFGDKPGFPDGKYKGTEEMGVFPFTNQSYPFSYDGEPLPFFQRTGLTLRFGPHQLNLIDRSTGDARGKPIALTRTTIQSIVTPIDPPVIFPRKPVVPPPTPRLPFQALGRLVVLPVGQMVFGIDAAKGELLWEKNLYDPAGPAGAMPTFQSVTVDPRGGVEVLYSDGWEQRLGVVMPLSPSALCLMTRDGLMAVDPLTGQTLWRRTGIGSRAHFFGDDEHVFVVEVGADGAPSATRVLRLADGTAVPAADFAAVCRKQIRLVGRNLLTADNTPAGVTLGLYDPLAGKDLWNQTYPARSIPLDSLHPNLAGVVDPVGQVRVVNLRTQKEVLNTKIDPKYLEEVSSASLLADGKDFYVALNAPLPADTIVMSAQLPEGGLRELPVNGEVFAFAAGTGKMHWHHDSKRRRLILDPFEELPVVLFAAQVVRFDNPIPGPGKTATAILAVDKRTGKLLYSNDDFKGGPFHSLLVDAAKGRIELIAPEAKVTFVAEEK